MHTLEDYRQMYTNLFLSEESAVRVRWNGSIANSPSPTEEQPTVNKVILRRVDGTTTVRELRVDSEDDTISVDDVTYIRDGSNRAGWPIYTEGRQMTEEETTFTTNPLNMIRYSGDQHTSGIAMAMDEERRRLVEELERAENPDITNTIRQKLDYLLIHGLDRRIEPTAILLNPQDYHEYTEEVLSMHREDLRGMSTVMFYHNRWRLEVHPTNSVPQGEVRLMI